jgi:hypothetical protein
VVAETCFLVANSGFDPSLALQFIQRGAVQVPFALQEQITAVSSLLKRYGNVPASLADAVLVRMSEIPMLLLCSPPTATFTSIAATAARTFP